MSCPAMATKSDTKTTTTSERVPVAHLVLETSYFRNGDMYRQTNQILDTIYATKTTERTEKTEKTEVASATYAKKPSSRVRLLGQIDAMAEGAADGARLAIKSPKGRLVAEGIVSKPAASAEKTATPAAASAEKLAAAKATPLESLLAGRSIRITPAAAEAAMSGDKNAKTNAPAAFANLAEEAIAATTGKILADAIREGLTESEAEKESRIADERKIEEKEDLENAEARRKLESLRMRAATADTRGEYLELASEAKAIAGTSDELDNISLPPAELYKEEIAASATATTTNIRPTAGAILSESPASAPATANAAEERLLDLFRSLSSSNDLRDSDASFLELLAASPLAATERGFANRDKAGAEMALSA